MTPVQHAGAGGDPGQAASGPAIARIGSHCQAAWRSLTGREVGWFLLGGMLYGLLSLNQLQSIQLGDEAVQVISRHLAVPMLCALCLLLAWLPADRLPLAWPHRPLWLLASSVAGSAVAIAGLTWLVLALDWPSFDDVLRRQKGLPVRPAWSATDFLADLIAMLIPSGMGLAVMELLRRRQALAAAAATLMRDHDAQVNQTLASRLETVQARLEPDLLFNLLVDIEARYAQGDPEATPQLDRLIHHLRLVLPRTAHDDATLGAEAESVGTWIALMGTLRHADWQFQSRVEPALQARRLPTPLLLPWVRQACAAEDSAQPLWLVLDAEPLAAGLRICLTLNRPGRCGDAAALPQSLRPWDSATARVHCETDEQATRWILELDE